MMSRYLTEAFGFSADSLRSALNNAVGLCYEKPVRYRVRFLAGTTFGYQAAFPPKLRVVLETPPLLGVFFTAVTFTIPSDTWRVRVGRGAETLGVSILAGATAVAMLLGERQLTEQLTYWLRADKEIASDRDVVPSPAGAILQVLELSRDAQSFDHVRTRSASPLEGGWGPMPAPGQRIPDQARILELVQRFSLIVERAQLRPVEGA